MPYDKLDEDLEKKQKELINEINDNYKDFNITVPEPIYDDDGNIQNEKSIKDKLKLLLPLIYALWIRNKVIIDTKSTNVIDYTFLFYNRLFKVKKMSSAILTRTEISKVIEDTLIKRHKIIKWDKIIKGNAKVLDKRVKQIILNGLKNGKTQFQLNREIQKTLKLNSGKAKSIALTETNYYRSEALLRANEGQDAIKVWKYNYMAREPREPHKNANGTSVKGVDAYFDIGGNKTKAPQHFGIADQDINCHCSLQIQYK